MFFAVAKSMTVLLIKTGIWLLVLFCIAIIAFCAVAFVMGAIAEDSTHFYPWEDYADRFYGNPYRKKR